MALFGVASRVLRESFEITREYWLISRRTLEGFRRTCEESSKPPGTNIGSNHKQTRSNASCLVLCLVLKTLQYSKVLRLRLYSRVQYYVIDLYIDFCYGCGFTGIGRFCQVLISLYGEPAKSIKRSERSCPEINLLNQGIKKYANYRLSWACAAASIVSSRSRKERALFRNQLSKAEGGK